MKRIISIIAIVLLLSVIAYVLLSKSDKDDYSYVLLKINPEVELGVDVDNIVREVNPLNEDADILLSDMELIGKQVEDATEEILDSTLELGQLNNNVELLVINSSEESRLKLETKMKEKIESHIQERKLTAELTINGVTDEMKETANTYEISYGKMLLVSKAIELNPELKEEDLVGKEIKEIQSFIKDVVEERHAQTNKTNEELNETWKNQKEELKKQNTESTIEQNTEQNSGSTNNQERNTQNDSTNGSQNNAGTNTQNGR